MRIDDYAEIWEVKDAITTVVEANGYAVYDLRHTDYGFRLELNRHIDDEVASDLCSQFQFTADYLGEGDNGTVICLYR